jgi:23S rRNA pseudouridine1911/1915/1917 synthase
MKKELIVPKELAGERLDKFLSKEIDFISRTKMHTLIKKGDILINGKVKKPSYNLKENDLVCINIEQEVKKDKLKPYKFDVNIIYEDDDVIIVDKPAHLVVHPPQEGYNETLVNALLYMGKELSTINDLRRGVVHRLDKATSGVMVLAKNDFAHLNLVQQFKERKVKKEYRALCWGETKQKHLVIDLPLRRDEKNRLKMKVGFTKSKEARTEVEVAQHLKEATYFILRPLTGRMHQIRVHLKFLGYPIVGDKKYGIKDEYSNLFLHAANLGFYQPRTAKFLEFSSPIPKYFEDFITQHLF